MKRLYTAAGDDGFTGLMKEGRFPKDDALVEAVGTIDEANAALGVARSICESELCRKVILSVQRDLYQIMAEVAASPENAERFRKVEAEQVSWLEKQIEIINAEVETPMGFIVPGDSHAAATIDLARTIVRRAERRAAGLVHKGILENRELLRYLNRLSSLCFVLELLEIQKSSGKGPTLALKNK